MILDKIKARGEDLSPLEGHDRLQYIIDVARDCLLYTSPSPRDS